MSAGSKKKAEDDDDDDDDDEKQKELRMEALICAFETLGKAWPRVAQTQGKSGKSVLLHTCSGLHQLLESSNVGYGERKLCVNCAPCTTTLLENFTVRFIPFVPKCWLSILTAYAVTTTACV